MAEYNKPNEGQSFDIPNEGGVEASVVDPISNESGEASDVEGSWDEYVGGVFTQPNPVQAPVKEKKRKSSGKGAEGKTRKKKVKPAGNLSGLKNW